jgi:hypothetical protein
MKQPTKRKKEKTELTDKIQQKHREEFASARGKPRKHAGTKHSVHTLLPDCEDCTGLCKIVPLLLGK